MPQTDLKATTRRARFWDKIADRYAAKPVSDEAAYQEKLRITRDHLTPESTVVEFGCGTGTTALAHAPYVSHILATDVSSRMIEIAKEKAASAEVSNVTFAQSAIEEMEIAPGSVDVVMGHSILHLVDDPETVIADVRAMLKPGGVFISSTVCLGTWKMVWFRLVAPLGRLLGLFPMVKIFSAETLRANLTQAGFRIEHDWQPKDGLTLFVVARKPGKELG